MTDALSYFAQHGLKEVTLRSLAPKLNTSHRMLIYYFGSAEQFWQALTIKSRKSAQEGTAMLAGVNQLPDVETMWRFLTSPDRLPYVRLLFELFGRALADPDANRDNLDSMVSRWLDVLATSLERQYGLRPEAARVKARLLLAVIRGLMMDLLVTRDVKGTHDAVRLFAGLFAGLVEDKHDAGSSARASRKKTR